MTLEEAEILSPSRIERVLEMACTYGVSLSVVAISHDKTYHFRSRMLEMLLMPETRHIIIEYPTTDGPAIALKPHMDITLSFTIDEGQFGYESKVIRKTSVPVKGRPDMAVLEISYPNVLKHSQRRDHFRISIPTGRAVRVTCRIIGPNDSMSFENAKMTGHQPNVQFNGQIVNLSGGGMLMAIEKAPDISLDTGTELLMSFSLVQNETPIEINGIVRRVHEKNPPQEREVAIEFIGTGEIFEYKLAINRLYKYIAERQRRMTDTHGR
jgi:c-di-GMP-binding flagellar brake protein YcgR